MVGIYCPRGTGAGSRNPLGSNIRHYVSVNELGYDLTLTPAGRLLLRESGDDVEAISDAWTKRVAAAFSSSQASGLFALAATRPDVPL